MAYIGIGYQGDDSSFLERIVEENMPWLKGDRVPRLFGNKFIVLYDSNTAREFAHKCISQAAENTITVYVMEKSTD